jgi:hypothetical protein
VLGSRGDSSDDPNGSVYSACGRASSQCRIDLVDADVIAAQGFVFNAVEAVGDTFLTSEPASQQKEVLLRWASLASASLPNMDHSAASTLFATTIIAGASASASALDGCYQTFQFESSARGSTITYADNGDSHGDFVVRRNNACTGYAFLPRIAIRAEKEDFKKLKGSS